MRKKVQKKHSGFWVVAVAVACLCFVFLYKTQVLVEEKEVKAAEKAKLEAKYDEELSKTEELKDRRSYMSTIKYIEDLARECLGMVYENEIIFKLENDDSE